MDRNSRGSSVAKLIQRFRDGRPADRATRKCLPVRLSVNVCAVLTWFRRVHQCQRHAYSLRKEIEALMWWHEKASGSKGSADGLDPGKASKPATQHLPEHTPHVPESTQTQPAGLLVPDILASSRRLDDQQPVHALLQLAKGNPALYQVRACSYMDRVRPTACEFSGWLWNKFVLQALMNLQTGPSGTISPSTLMSVQHAVATNHVQEQPHIAAFRHHEPATARPHTIAARLDCAIASENDMVVANNSPFQSDRLDQLNPPHLPKTVTPSASLREWASGPSSHCSRSSSPADRFARLQVSLRVTDRKLCNTQSPSCSPSPSQSPHPSRSHTSSPVRSKRNVDGEPYHPLARDYPVSSSAGEPSVGPALFSVQFRQRRLLRRSTCVWL